jgi:DNA-binding transcriptional LysR family regulator
MYKLVCKHPKNLALIDGQGIALWDQLVTPEINSSHLQYLSDIWLDEYGYYVHARKRGTENKALRLFFDWLIAESRVS